MKQCYSYKFWRELLINAREEGTMFTQIMSYVTHIFDSCPESSLDGGLLRLHSADDYAVPGWIQWQKKHLRNEWKWVIYLIEMWLCLERDQYVQSADRILHHPGDCNARVECRLSAECRCIREYGARGCISILLSTAIHADGVWQCSSYQFCIKLSCSRHSCPGSAPHAEFADIFC